MVAPTPVRAWHWTTPTPQGNFLYTVVANDACGVLAVGDESTILRSTDDGLTWSTRQLPERWRFTSAAVGGTYLYAVGDTADASVLLRISACGDGEPKPVRSFDRKHDGAANAVGADADGRVYLTALLPHKHGEIFCSVNHGDTFVLCNDQPRTPYYGVFIDSTGAVYVAGGYGGSDGGLVRHSSDHGRTWGTLGRHLGDIAYGVWGDSNGKRLIVTGRNEISATSDGGATWSTTLGSGFGNGGSMLLGKVDAPYVPDSSSVLSIDPSSHVGREGASSLPASRRVASERDTSRVDDLSSPPSAMRASVSPPHLNSASGVSHRSQRWPMTIRSNERGWCSLGRPPTIVV